MRHINCRAQALVVLAGLLTGSASARLVEQQKGVFVEDFAPEIYGELESAGLKGPKSMKITKPGGKSALHLRGAQQSVLYYGDTKYKDFVLEVEMQKKGGSYAGVVVRDHWRVYFQMRNYLALNASCRRRDLPSGQLWKSSGRFGGKRTLKIVCVGPVLHAYVDGKSMFKYTIPDEPGRIGFYAHNGEAYYHRFRVDTHVDPLEAVTAKPVAPDDALVFDPGKNVDFKIDVGNYTDTAQQVRVSAAVKTWDDEVLKEGSRQVRAVGGNTPVEFDMGRLPKGFYKVAMQAECGGRQVASNDDIPLAVHERWNGTFEAPLIPIAPYSKYQCETSPLYKYTYAHAIARSLRDHHINAIVACPMMFGYDTKVFDIFHSYGVAIVARSGGNMGHPAVVGALVHDEPKMEEMPKLKKQYEQLRAKTDKPFTTCLVGEATGLGGSVPKWEILEPTGPGLRAFRWYGVKKSFYDALHPLHYKGNLLPLADVLRVVEASSETPYWFVPPSFGATQHEGYFMNPTPAQMKTLMHLPMAYGCRGLLPFCLQPQSNRESAMIEQKSIKPCDGKYAAMAEVAKKINAHAKLLVSLTHGGFDVRCRSPFVEVVPRKDPTGKLYVYVVNKNARAPVETQLLVWADSWRLDSVKSVYDGKALPVRQDAEGYLTMPLSLEPGDGDLLVTDARRK